MASTFEIVPFHQHHILTVKQDDGVFVVMKPIVEALGLTWHGQFERINRHPVIREGVRVTRIPSAGGMQESMSLNLEQFHGWLLTLTPDRIKDDAKRELIVRYQREASRVVFEHFHGKIGRPHRTAKEVSAYISMQNQALRLMRRLQNTTHPLERRAMHTLLDTLCQQINIDTPALDQLGHDAVPIEDKIKAFWDTFNLLLDRGHRVNYSRKNSMIAIHLKTMEAAVRAEKLNIAINADLLRAIEQSTLPRFIDQKPVNCVDGKPRHCWVFSVC